MPRAHNFNRKKRALIALRAGGCCEKCHAKLKVGEGEADHILPVELGGESEVENGQWLCRVCHRVKTTDDIQCMRKAERMHDKHHGIFPPSKARIPSRPFSTSRGAP